MVGTVVVRWRRVRGGRVSLWAPFKRDVAKAIQIPLESSHLSEEAYRALIREVSHAREADSEPLDIL